MIGEQIGNMKYQQRDPRTQLDPLFQIVHVHLCDVYHNQECPILISPGKSQGGLTST